MQRLKVLGMQKCRVKYIHDEDSEEEGTNNEEERLLLRVEGKGNNPFYMERIICGKLFKTNY